LIKDKTLEELHPALWPFANKKLTVSELEKARDYMASTSFYDIVLKEDSCVKQKLCDRLRESIFTIKPEEIEDFFPEKRFYLLDLDIKEPSKINKECVLSLISKIRSVGGQSAFLKPLPRCLFEKETEEIPHTCSNCMALMLGLCKKLPEKITDENALNKLLKEMKKESRPECAECRYFLRNQCRIFCKQNEIGK
jgi:hypothetical protein